ncbi:MAG: hypothetical protein IT166_08600 [Bryobacterales bacterium]|nr:hypothetical protein [Bryobacterales bacterium]
MEKVAAVHVQAGAAELPIGAEQEMEPEELPIRFIQRAFADEIEIGDEFFVFPAPDITAILAAGPQVKGGPGDVFLLLSTVTKPVVTNPEYGAQHAIARLNAASSANPHAGTAA